MFSTHADLKRMGAPSPHISEARLLLHRTKKRPSFITIMPPISPDPLAVVLKRVGMLSGANVEKEVLMRGACMLRLTVKACDLFFLNKFFISFQSELF